MTEVQQLLSKILEHGDTIGRDAAGRTIVQLALDHTILARVMVFGAEAAESEDGGDDEPYVVPRVWACWLEAA